MKRCRKREITTISIVIINCTCIINRIPPIGRTLSGGQCDVIGGLHSSAPIVANNSNTTHVQGT